MTDGSTKLFRMAVAPTGQKHIVHLGCATTDLLLDFDHESNASDSQIDNVLFVGSAEAVANDVQTLLDRCDVAQVTLNDRPASVSDVVNTSVNWIGMRLDFKNKTVQLLEKSILKIRLSLNGIDGWSWQGFAAHMGLVWWAFQVLQFPISGYFNLLRFASKVNSMMEATNHKAWKQKAVIEPAAMLDLRSVTDHILSNAPVYVPPRQEPEIFVLVDSAKSGWGYIAYDSVTGTCYQGGGAWPRKFAQDNQERLHRSTFTEPYGVIFSLRDILNKVERPNPSFFYGCDNQPTVFVFNKRFSSQSYTLNHCADIMVKEFGHLQFDIVHVEGASNVCADAISRGKNAQFGDDIILECLRRLLGDLPAEPNSKGAGKGAVVLPIHPVKKNLCCLNQEGE